MERKEYVLKNSKNKFIRFYNFYLNIYYKEFTEKRIDEKYNIFLSKIGKKHIKSQNEIDEFYDLCVESFDFMRDFTILMSVRFENFVQEFQLFKNESPKNCISFSDFMDLYIKVPQISDSIICIKQYFLINNYSKHGYGKSMKKILSEKIKVTEATKYYYSLEDYINSDDKRLVNIGIEEIEEYYNSILIVMNYLIEAIVF